MKKNLSALLLFVILSNTTIAQEKVIARNPEVITGQLIRVTKPLSKMTPADKLIPDVPVRDLNGIIGKDEEFEEGEAAPNFGSSSNSDGALQHSYPNNPHSNNGLNRAIVSNFNGIGYQPLNPPDPTMCAGPNHIIQMINGSSGALFKVFNKTGGQVVAQTYLDAITGKGGLGDPIALYDQLADRFVLLEFANKPENGNQEGLVIAVTQTSDPAGAWYVYFFPYGNTFPDYPKLSVWNDAYYATTNDFANGSSYSGSSAWAFDRSKMIAGNVSATAQRFTLGSTNKHFSMCPVLLQGTTLPPAGTGGLIAYMQDDAWTAAADLDSIGMFEFNVNFTTPASTVITTKVSLNTAAYKSDVCSATRGQCITQPGTSIKVEALHQKIQNQPVYRRFAGYEGIVMAHAVDKGSNIAGVRWYELRKTTGNWSINQQSTYAPDNTNRFLPGVCYDSYGNIALAYNVSSSATGVYPGARYTGRKECDPLNTLTYSEDVLIAGSASNSSTRYGDYNHLVCDPDGVTFWFTCEYNVASTWSTRISSFTLDPCIPPVCGDPTGLANSAITNTSATVSWTAVANAISYDVDYKLNTSSIWTNAATATASTSVNLSGLIQGSLYDWRVRATCSGGSGNYIAAQFTTTAPCGTPANPVSSAITGSTATVGWTLVSGANNYDVDYKDASTGTWINAATATASNSVTITGLTASTLYDWRVRANCASGTSGYLQAQFTTGVTGCPDILEPNNTLATAAAISVGINYNALIATNGDNDYYAFNNTSAMRRIRVTLTNLPANYDLALYKPNGTQAAASANTGTTPETIIYNANKNNQIGTYKAYVYGFNGAFNATQCYTLLVELSATNFGPANSPDEDKIEIVKQGGLKLYPVPASKTVTVSFDADARGKAEIIIIDQVGTVVLRKIVSVDQGINFNNLDISKLSSGVYTVKMTQSKEVKVQKLVIQQ